MAISSPLPPLLLRGVYLRSFSEGEGGDEEKMLRRAGGEVTKQQEITSLAL